MLKPWEEEKLWILDSIGIGVGDHTLLEDKIYQEFCKSVTYANNQYIVRLPWKNDNSYLTPNYGMAKGRLRSALTRLKEKGLVETYTEILRDQIERGFIEKVNNTRSPLVRCHYIPHLPVIRENHATTPIRIVFDASAKCPDTGYSLNDMLYTGPSLVPDLTKVLLRFRWNKYVAISDISKAFLMVGLNEEDRDFTRFLWPKEPLDDKSELEVFRFKSVLFGATSSPFLLQATIRYHFSKYKPKYDVNSEDLIRNLYVDNLHIGADTKSELLDLYRESVEGYLEAGLPLREWISNLSDLNKRASKDNIADTTGSEEVKMLGLLWNSVEDSLKLKPVELNSNASTKREVLAETCRIFDPLGYFFPVTIKARMLIQKLWKAKYDWDVQIKEDFKEEWRNYVEDTKELFQCAMNRRVFEGSEPATLHIFADASTEAMGCCAYVRQNKKTSLLMAKARVAPVKELTVPKLELTASLLAGRLANYIMNTFDREITFESVHIWLDSQIALCWLLQDEEHNNLFVNNRVKEFKINVPKAILHYVVSDKNPADLLTRVKPIRLVGNDLWWNGPELLNSEELWVPYNPGNGAKVIATVLNTVAIKRKVSKKEALPDVSRFNNLDKLLRVTSYVNRIVKFLLGLVKGVVRSGIVTGNIAPEELGISEKQWLIEHQQVCFSQELAYLKGESKSKTPIIEQLCLKYDDGVIKVHSRLQNSELPKCTINPVLISDKHEFSKLLILDAHERTYHGSTTTVVGYLRKRFWLPRCRQVVKSVINKCPTCKLLRGTPYSVPVMPPLPINRVTEAEPFQFTGVDYTGALYVKEGVGLEKKKVYIALFTCLCTRAIHLEVAVNASTDAFCNVFRRFVAHNTAPQVMYSDRGSNFVGFQPVLKEIMNSDQMNSELLKHRTSWRFIPAKAPWMGGIWERLVGITKTVLKRVLGNAFVNLDELQTIVAEICTRVNCRPITHTSDSVDDLIPLTPIQLIKGTIPDVLPTRIDEDEFTDKTFNPTPAGLSKRHKRIIHLINLAWKRWSEEYLLTLRERDKLGGLKEECTIKPALGDVVLFHSDVGSKCLTLGRVIQLIQGSDGECRVVKLKIKGGESIRPVAKLAYLESAPFELNDKKSLEELCSNKNEANCQQQPARPQRQAALSASKKIQAIIMDESV